ncbi:unnamed protein product [Mytilus coruscus]|uniref:Uncharacterized protein n=1 Tax=Mytilus coruscus TaxID=42192 RepID=A0A6J8EG76_MYTCO|nr:unnamed protein product [Mytilus coruscus]
MRNQNITDLPDLNNNITRDEIVKAVEHTKLRKAAGYDEIPSEVLKNESAIDLLHVICNGCFELGKVPEQWTCGVVNPILKPGTNDKRLPTNYRGITITSVPSKIYCSVLNSRLCKQYNADKNKQISRYEIIASIIKFLANKHRHLGCIDRNNR